MCKLVQIKDKKDPNKIDETPDELLERISHLEAQLGRMKGRARGKTELIRAIKDARRNVTARTLKGQLEWVLNDEKILTRYRKLWLSDKSSIELNYPIFFAVSENGGKDNSGEPNYKKGYNDQLILDKIGHLVVEHDLDKIADAFVAFAKD